ncbi:hypothetical protein BACCOPRO_03823 [Phocaeicola coprophilus DSM 18228 = JCM 13818]|uniref:Uncharacterized protein n=1 Tax=Phocaeicola coprophilus DSM 18228 = JCM 13818 TaxID=547042 RepID=S0FEV2_9BACT|nr:hypothetical protein BACCOPRO_03823 [Phocaeicola coprophilus DSM 18228 = JCM 13818]
MLETKSGFTRPQEREKRGWSTGIKKGVPLYSNLFINLKSNTMKTRCKGTGFPVNCKSFQKKNMFNNIF